jgi:hypothetical protein
VFVEQRSQSGAGTVIDAVTGRQQAVVAPGCNSQFDRPWLGGPWLMFVCQGPGLQLGALATGAWRTITPAPSVQDASRTCEETGPGSCGGVNGVGASWIGWEETPYHGYQRRLFQNIGTGKVRKDPTTATRIVDLNSPTLTRSLCPPLHTPRLNNVYGAGTFYGALEFYGTFAVAQGLASHGSAAYLEHCGSRLHRLLTNGPTQYQFAPLGASTRALIWQSSPATLTGLFLPGLQRFIVRLPHDAVLGTWAPADFSLPQIALTPRSLYIRTATGDLWTAKSPSLSLTTSQRPAKHTNENAPGA